ncbi:MAG: hypothetical protein KatS3mg082_1438 [Nitrospiraceae bacterium]|nr:MAG: hypothetical protein KatS3mg082_1438 [Nitrospiraceae bacterium]
MSLPAIARKLAEKTKFVKRTNTAQWQSWDTFVTMRLRRRAMVRVGREGGRRLRGGTRAVCPSLTSGLYALKTTMTNTTHLALFQTRRTLSCYVDPRFLGLIPLFCTVKQIAEKVLISPQIEGYATPEIPEIPVTYLIQDTNLPMKNEGEINVFKYSGAGFPGLRPLFDADKPLYLGQNQHFFGIDQT